MIIYQFINGCSTNEVKIYFHICDHSIIKFGGKFYLGFLNTSNVDSLDRFRKTLVDKVKPDISISKKQNHSKEEKTRINMQMNSLKIWDWAILNMWLSSRF